MIDSDHTTYGIILLIYGFVLQILFISGNDPFAFLKTINADVHQRRYERQASWANKLSLIAVFGADIYIFIKTHWYVALAVFILSVPHAIFYDEPHIKSFFNKTYRFLAYPAAAALFLSIYLI
jgi:hypothetical protein